MWNTLKRKFVPCSKRYPTHLPLLAGVLLVHNGLHLVPVLHQHHGQVFVGELPHREGKVVGPGDAAAKQSGLGIKIPADVDVNCVKGHCHFGSPFHAVTAWHGEGRAELCVVQQAGETPGLAGVAQPQEANQHARMQQHFIWRRDKQRVVFIYKGRTSFSFRFSTSQSWITRWVGTHKQWVIIC